jgi:hypothetical protein
MFRVSCQKALLPLRSGVHIPLRTQEIPNTRTTFRVQQKRCIERTNHFLER